MGCVPFYFGADYLYWYMKRDSLPPLITEGNPQQATVLASTPGALGVPGTVQIAPNLNGTTAHSGVRINAGAWFDKEEVLGIQGSYFFLFDSGPKTSVISTGGPDSPLIARPFFDTTTVAQSAVTVFSPAGQGGGLTINNPSRLMGGDVNIVYNFAASTLTGNRCGLLVGARYLGLDETLNIDQVNIPYGSPSVGTWTNENFTTHNHFYGGQIGLSSENLIGPVYIQAIGKVAVGQNSQQVVLSGYGSPLLIPSSYIGSYNHNVTSCVPEGQFNVGYRFNDNFMFKAGYNVIALTNAVRPSGAMNTNISETPITTSPTSFHNTTFWTQGVSLGLQWNF